ncbi:NUDIX hydrolase [Paenibacillus marinisediminis]
MQRIDVVYSLITNDSRSKILMVKNKDNESWTLPGGAVEKNETLEIAAIREAKEETGLDIKVFGIVAVNEYINEGKNEHIVFFTFRAEIVSGIEEIIRPDEILEIEWIDLEQADILMPYYKEGLSK